MIIDHPHWIIHSFNNHQKTRDYLGIFPNMRGGVFLILKQVIFETSKSFKSAKVTKGGEVMSDQFDHLKRIKFWALIV